MNVWLIVFPILFVFFMACIVPIFIWILDISLSDLSKVSREKVRHAAVAFLSGIVVEILYSTGTILLINNQRAFASFIAVAWGIAFLFGVHESFKTKWAAGLYCIGLGIGTFIGSWIMQGKNHVGL